MMRLTLGILGILPLMLQAQTFQPVQTEEQIKAELNFLVSTVDGGDNVGFAYTGTAERLSGKVLPLSYYSTARYWADYVGSLPGNNLRVTNVFHPGDYTVGPQDPFGSGGLLQVERVNVYNGANIYDAACWQIALAVCGSNGLGQHLFSLAENQDTLLLVGYDGQATQATPGANRATTRGAIFKYNGASIAKAENAYYFRMVPRNWLSRDPFVDTEYMSYITTVDLPPDNPDYKPGYITWTDWKPITGENAWAFFIGPLQTAMLKSKAAGNRSIPFSSTTIKPQVPFTSTAVQNALGTLVGLAHMQSEIGGIYYACKGSLGNVGGEPVNPYEVSVENNASALAGLVLFHQILNDQLQSGLLSESQTSQVNQALAIIDTMLHGGTTPQGLQTKGLLAFFREHAWNQTEGLFYQGGIANDPGASTAWSPTSEPKAVDVNTWGVTAIGQRLLDSWFGFGTAYRNWQNVKTWGGFYGPDGTLWGVGYSNKDREDGGAGINSAEWTAGAINMLRCLIQQYGEVGTQEAAGYVDDLQRDHDSMVKNLLTLRTDRYPTEPAYADVRPKGAGEDGSYEQLVPIPSGKLAFLYASKRYFIPFGWYANPLPSTTSTSWAIMLHYQFNPLAVGGSYATPAMFENLARRPTALLNYLGQWTKRNLPGGAGRSLLKSRTAHQGPAKQSAKRPVGLGVGSA